MLTWNTSAHVMQLKSFNLNFTLVIWGVAFIDLVGNQRNKPKNVDCHQIEFVKIIKPFKGEMFVIDDEFDESKHYYKMWV